MKDLQDKFRGCLLGGAAGDALGYTVEFMGYDDILQRYGERGITRYELNGDGVAEISDDTQMTLYSANGLLIGDVEAAYIEWYQTQNYCADVIRHPKCRISNVPEMYARRAPGNTCMSALRSLTHGLEVCNDSKGCGGIMRAAPFGLFYALRSGVGENNGEALPLERTAKLACEAARLTHKHPMGFLPAGLFAATIQNIIVRTRRLMADGDCFAAQRRDRISRQEFWLCVGGALHAIVSLCKCSHDYSCCQDVDELFEKTNAVFALAEGSLPDEAAVGQLGEGWTGDEAWYIAVYCTLKHFDCPEQAIIAAVNHSGDSDSTGAICGNLIGAIYGYEALAEHFKPHLELHDVILKMADDLYVGRDK